MKNYRIEVLYLLNGVRVTDPFGRSRDRVNVLRPDSKTGKPIPLEFVEHGVVIGEAEFVPYGSFYAAGGKVEAPKAVEKAPEPVQEAQKPGPAPKPRRRAKSAPKKS